MRDCKNLYCFSCFYFSSSVIYNWKKKFHSSFSSCEKLSPKIRTFSTFLMGYWMYRLFDERMQLFALAEWLSRTRLRAMQFIDPNSNPHDNFYVPEGNINHQKRGEWGSNQEQETLLQKGNRYVGKQFVFESVFNLQNIQSFRSQVQSRNVSIFKAYKFKNRNWTVQ